MSSLIHFLFVILAQTILLASCANTKTKADCIAECKSRGAEYTGIVPRGYRTELGYSEDICQCK